MPPALRKLTALQDARQVEIAGIRARLAGKPQDSLNKVIVQSRLDAIKEIWVEARRTHSEIIVREDAETDPYVVNSVFGHIQGIYENALDEFLTLLARFEVAEEPAPRPVITDISVAEVGSEVRVAQLPKIPLPTFSGKYEDWDSFCDLFTTLVHEAPRVSDATKLQYLKLCLKGGAAELIKDVTTTNANYASTWQALKARYHNPRLIINKHLSAFMEIPYLKKESASELRSFTDEAQRIVRALSNLKLPVKHWDVWFIYLLSERLDPESRKAWESELSARDRQTRVNSNNEEQGSEVSSVYPNFSVFVEFLEKRAQTLSMMAPNPRVEDRRAEKRPAPPSKSAPARKSFHASSSSTKPHSAKCALCSGSHSLMKCFTLKKKTVSERLAEIKRLQLCFNCFGQHRVHACTSSGRCSICQDKHHTLLHFPDRGSSRATQQGSNENHTSQADNSTARPPVVSLHAARPMKNVLLATARVLVIGPNGGSTCVRALLDQGSEASFLSESIAQLLRLPRQRTRVPLTGLGASSSGVARSTTTITLQSTVDAAFRIETDALILPRLTSLLPSNTLDRDLNFDWLSGIELADPDFAVSGKVDLILGADVYGQLLRSEVRKAATSQLVAQNTVLGWIVSGPVKSSLPRRAVGSGAETPVQAFHCASEQDLDVSLQRFWTLEEVAKSSIGMKPEDERCERMFQEGHSRDAQGRYEVKLPLKPHPPSVGAETRSIALGSLAHMHRRFERDPKLAQAYREFMEVYEKLGHMSRVPVPEIHKQKAWYLPHHAVVQSTEKQWKLRVVFDASRRTRDGSFLNDFLYCGPPLQGDLSLILLNWRRYRFAFTADIVKMFRQIAVKAEDQDYQRIVWAPSSDADPIDYRLTTVTYGTACAPYLAIRTLSQLVRDEGHRFPLGAQCLTHETYVDDTFAGANELSTARQKRIELSELLGSAGIKLDKWAANHAELLPEAVQQDMAKRIDADDSVKTLGVHWNPSQDEFRFDALDIESLSAAYTKRSVLSNIARLFDPLGWLAPITVTAKILMQDMWILKYDWDSPLPAEIRERWYEYCKSLSALSSLSIDRWLGITESRSCQIHGFADASSRAYAAVVYLRITDCNGQSHVSLLTAKSKVAPVKTVSIPNLELCGAALLVKLLCHVRKLNFLSALPVHAWSDSQIVLNWLRKHPCHWKTFVANRVSYIQTELPSATWNHVPTKENPADLATRGAQPAELAGNALWWHGPAWLSNAPAEWPRPAEPARAHHARPGPAEPEILGRFSSLNRLIRVVAYCRRPLVKLRRRKNGLEMPPNFLSSSELSEARATVIRLAQSEAFESEIKTLQAKKRLPKRNSLNKLYPFLSSTDGILRVGGRLSNSNLSFDRKHPPILPHNSALSQLWVRQAHHACLHGGPTLTSSVVMQQVWIIGRNRLVKTAIRKCVPCQRVKPRSVQQLMGDLPAGRVTPGRAFSTSGLDYAGPFQVRTTKGRGYKSYKGYIVLFVCFATRAIHLELVSDLTTASFLSAYRRFVGRRGICQNLYSDNATNFHGADKELREMFQRASEFYEQTAALLANDGTNWTFIPPNAPHYGGLWEAGVKSVKHHLKRAVGEHTFTFEELSTILVEIEACLNSRPLSALSSDAKDLRALTPSHFLNEGVSVLLPDSDIPGVPENRLTRFQLMQRVRNQFWKRWSTEYLLHLQQREKWREPEENITIGQLVLVQDDRYPPAKWPLGRVTEVHPGPDNLVRVVTVRTATSSLRRHIARLCPLFLEDGG